MKRKATDQPHPGPISAVAARRARQNQAAAAEQPPPPPQQAEQQSDSGPPLKKPRAAATENTRKSSRLQNKSKSPKSSSKQSSRPSNGRRAARNTEPTETDTVVGDFNDATGEGDSVQPSSDGSESDTGSESHVTAPQAQENFLLSKARLEPQDIVYKTKNSVCIRLKTKSTTAIIGQYDLWVKRGVVSIMGAKLHSSPKSYRVYAPSTHSLPVIKCVSGIEGYAEVEITSCHNGLAGLRRISDLYGRIWNSQQVTQPDSFTGIDKPSFSFLHSSSDDPYNRHLRPLHLEKEWSGALNRLSQTRGRLRLLTCGPKGSGKSTFNKCLLNHLLSTTISPNSGHGHGGDGVAFLDLDPGQPEFSTAGNIYLAHLHAPVLGPSFTHPTLNPLRHGRIVRSHHIGTTSPKDDPNHYSLSAMDLMDHYRVLLQTHPQCPLIINYPGWIFGQGLEVAIWLVKSLGISDVVYMSDRGPEEVVVPLQAATSEADIPFTVLPSQPTEYASRSSSQLRAMQMLSYFHMKDVDNACEPSWSAIPIDRHRTIRINYSGPKQGIQGILAPGFRHDANHLYDLLDGSIVSITAVEDPNAIMPLPEHTEGVNNDTDNNDETIADGDTNLAASEPGNDFPNKLNPILTRTTRENLPYLFIGNGTCAPLDPKISYSLGVGIVRSINTDSQTVELVTPTPAASIRNALEEKGHQIVLVRGHMDNPNWALCEEYFAARSAHKRLRNSIVRRTSNNNGNGSGNNNISRSMEEAAQARIERDRLAENLRERTRRASRGPWLRIGDVEMDDISKVEKNRSSGRNKGKKKGKNKNRNESEVYGDEDEGEGEGEVGGGRLWKLRKQPYSADSGSGSEREW